MFKLLRNKRAQTTLEYAILIGVVAAALIAMQMYLKRGYQGKIRDSADSMGGQFSPGLTAYNYSTNTFSDSTETIDAGTTKTQIHAQNSYKSGNESVANLEQETML